MTHEKKPPRGVSGVKRFGVTTDPRGALSRAKAMAKGELPAPELSHPTVSKPDEGPAPGAGIESYEESIMEAASDLNAPRVAKYAISPEPPIREVAPVQTRMRVEFRTDAGTFGIDASDVVLSDSGVLVLMPATGGATFVPTAGSKLAVAWSGGCERCYFPGLSFNIKALDALSVAMIRIPEGE